MTEHSIYNILNRFQFPEPRKHEVSKIYNSTPTQPFFVLSNNALAELADNTKNGCEGGSWKDVL